MIHNWSARRSGGRITIHGERHEAYGDGSFKRVPIKIAAIDSIMVEGDEIVAIDRLEREYRLSPRWNA